MANIITGRKSGVIVRGGVKRRQMLWIADVADANTVALGTALLIKTLNAAALALRPFTIVRTRGRIFIATDQSASTEAQTANYGHIVVTEEATAIGVTAIPTPVTQSSSDWHVFETIMAEMRIITAVSALEIGTSVVIDSKAMRKVDFGEDLAMVVETNATGVSEGVRFRDFAKVLVKLH